MSRNNDEQELQSWKLKNQRLIEDYKVCSIQALEDHGINENQVAAACGVSPSTITRWLDLTDKSTFPACLIPALNTPETLPLALAKLNFIATPLGRTIGIRYPIVGSLNADLTDETLEITQYVGRLAEKMKSGEIDPRKCERILRDLKTVVERGIEECKQLAEKA